MSEKESELNDDELNSLLSDLESKSGGGAGGGGVEVDDDQASEDIEAFLKSLDESEGEQAASSTPTKTADSERDAELDAKFAELDDLEPANLPEKTEDEGSEASSKTKSADEEKTDVAEKKDSGDESADEKGVSKKRKYALAAVKILAVSLPSLLFIWVLGAFLGNWVSAAWLVTIIAVAIGLGIPALIRHYAKKGKYMWWAIGSSIALVAALVAPMPGTAGNTLQKYGHWPMSFVAEVAGWEVDHNLVEASSFFSEQIGSLLPGAAADLEGKQLGTEHDLNVPIAEQPEAEPTPETSN